MPHNYKQQNLGAMLLFHLHRQARQHRKPITCGGVITILAIALGHDLGGLAQLIGERYVALPTLKAACMITSSHGRLCIRVPGVGNFFPTPIPNLFSIENGQLHYDIQGAEEEVEHEVEMPEDIPTWKQGSLKRRHTCHRDMPHKQPRQRSRNTSFDLA